MRYLMSIPDLLWGVLEKEGHGDIAKMARAKNVPQATLSSWMTRKGKYRRRPYSPDSLQTISSITGVSVGELVQMMADEAHDSSPVQVAVSST